MIIVILGPTASGKTAVASRLAKLVDGEIISADSRQIYKYLDVGTNKAGEWDSLKKLRVIDGIPQYLTDVVEPSETFSAGDFVREASKKIKYIKDRNKIPIFVGGTGLYIKALIDGLVPLPERNEEIRRELTNKLEKFGVEFLYESLQKVDPESALKNKNNPQRIIRALEVYKLTDKPLSVLHKQTKGFDERFLQFGLSLKRSELYDFINHRTHKMLESGMVEETKKVLDMGISPNAPGLQGIGYRYIIEFLNNRLSWDDMEERTKLDTRHYAKRQVTWFRKDNRIHWLEIVQKSFNPEEIANQMVNLL